jgi:dihydroorotate dehydrogenase (NAD+) catalytic subunit
MIEITLPRKTSIVVETPVLFAAGVAGYDGSPYRRLLSLDKFGALVTSPVTLKARAPASGPRVVPMTSGFLIHTGLPNRGIKRVIQEHQANWKRSVLPIILHMAASTPEEAGSMARIADQCPELHGLEIGLQEQASIREVQEILRAIRQNCELPILVRLPLFDALELSEVAQRNGADALVVAAPPRGTEREPHAGRLIGGRVYGPWLKSLSLRVVGRVIQNANVPVIGTGGIHTPEDARDFLAAGAVAVQLDTIVWVNPRMAEIIARNLGGLELTRTAGALSDEWEPGLGQTQQMQRRGQPTNLPEVSEDGTQSSRFDPIDFED